MGKWSRVRDIVTKPDYSIDPFSGTPPKGMVPSNIPGVYTTPEVVEPNDCDNYPDSIFCGGNPINNTPLDIDIEIKADRCGVSVKATPTLAYFKFPQTGVAYVKPECRNEPKPYNVPPTDVFDFTPRAEAVGFDRTIFNAEVVYAGIVYTALDETIRDCANMPNQPPRYVYPWYGRVNEGTYFQQGYDNYIENGGRSVQKEVICRYVTTTIDYDIENYCGRGSGDNQSATTGTEAEFYFSRLDSFTSILTINANDDLYRSDTPYGVNNSINPSKAIPPYYQIYEKRSTFNASVVYGKWGDIVAYYSKVNTEAVNNPIGFREITVVKCFDVLRPNEVPTNKYNEYPDTFNPVKRCECMGCCSPSPYEQNKEKEQERKRDECCEEIKKLLKEIKTILGTGKPKIEYYDIDPDKVDAQKKSITPKDLTLAIEELSKLHSITQKAIGVEEFPVQYPDSIVEPVNDGILGQVWDFITPDKVRKITSLAQMIDWGTDQQSATIGKLQRKIEQEVEDNRVQSDGTIKKGSKKVSVVIPDIATGIEEIFKMQLQLFKALGLNTDIGLKGLQEGVNSSVMSAEALQRIKSIQEFLSFPTDHKSIDHTIQITIPEKGREKDVEKDLLKYLQTSQTKIVWDEFDGSQTFYEMMIDVLGAAAIIRAVFYGRG